MAECARIHSGGHIRDQALSRLKSKIELMYVTNGNKKVVVVPHSMGVIYFLHFLKWVESPPPMGGGGGPLKMRFTKLSRLSIIGKQPK
ncbi:hypothetical protein RJ640_000100 [Escallonia rubra]|uniref:Uncharacterized protein n=1 Tax=Escallonia rubra TaxID=112253 RepID=A0AA88UA04_9ASTE|nr:hypothetical protein RJ640_000100 [Escallonia rubra]